MSSELANLLGQFGHVMAICPDAYCGEIFRLSEARPYPKDRKPHSILDDIDRENERIDNAVERLEEREADLRAQAKAQGLKNAKRRLIKVDPIFSGSRLDPQDVKVIFDPVEYVVFDGMSKNKLRRILFIGHEPRNKSAERILGSITKSVKSGNVEFKTLRVREDGGLGLI